MFLELIRGYAVSLARTSDSYAAIEYPQATVTKGFLTKSGLSVTGVSRVLPALAAWISAKRQPGVLSIEGKKFDLLDMTGSALTNGTNPDHKDYWQPARNDAQDQRQVEASIIAWAVWLLRDSLLPQMSTVERRRIDEWLASCTRFPVRRNNWAWFTAVNHAARLALKDKFDEFSYDQNAMFEDLRSLDAMSVGGGWYNDDKPRQSFDYYNSWVFSSHFLYWNALVGERFPDWSKVFSDPLRQYLDTAPMFFGSNGSHILYGRSLIYRWAVLTPLVLAYLQKLWPHDAATLHRIVRGSLEFHHAGGSYDTANGKLRETYSPEGTPAIRESYIDGGHPYWCMQAFSLWLIPRADPFWQADSGQLPVERGDFRRVLEAPGMVLTGRKSSGHVQLLQARSSKTDIAYRDKYNKFTYSSHFPPNLVQRADICPWDNALVLRDRKTRKSAGRGELQETHLLPDGMEVAYSIVFGGLKASVRTTIHIDGEFQVRIHRVIAPADIDAALEVVEGSAALGLAALTDGDSNATETYSIVKNQKTGLMIATWKGAGWSGLGASWDLGNPSTANVNLLFPSMLVNTLWANLRPGAQVLHSVHYASPKPSPTLLLHQTAARLLKPLSTGVEKRKAPATRRP
ncbi:MAG: DUF2264 domain-containing protein [Bryobacteraceae bacterium]|nr:DUF2264 domain-containing protein [Bryobacteraceae bacterium]